jgi:hypothetical protein
VYRYPGDSSGEKWRTSTEMFGQLDPALQHAQIGKINQRRSRAACTAPCSGKAHHEAMLCTTFR